MTEGVTWTGRLSGARIVRRPAINDAVRFFFDRECVALCCWRKTDWAINRNGKTGCPECDEAESARLLKRELDFARLG